MITLSESKDIRILILLYLEKQDYSLEQIKSNQMLSELVTSKGTRDLGTIRRSLEDLLGEGFIMETHLKKVIGSKFLLTYKADVIRAFPNFQGYDPKEFSNPQRFVEPVGNAPQIPDIHLGITLKGKAFLTERRNSEENQKLINHTIEELTYKSGMRPIERTVLYLTTAISIIGIIISIFGAGCKN